MFKFYEKSHTFDLFAIPRFITGIAATLDLGATLTQYNESQTVEEADLKAIRSDWRTVGYDLKKAMTSWEQNNA